MKAKKITPQQMQADLKSPGIVDTHHQVGPELLPRRYDVKTLADAANP